MKPKLELLAFTFGLILLISCKKDATVTQRRLYATSLEYTGINAYNRYGSISNNNFHIADIKNDTFFIGNLIKSIFIKSDNSASFKYDSTKFQITKETITANMIVNYKKDSIFFSLGNPFNSNYKLNISGRFNQDSIVLRGAYLILSKGALGEFSYEPLAEQHFFTYVGLLVQ